jgi:hypothetical protein
VINVRRDEALARHKVCQCRGAAGRAFVPKTRMHECGEAAL